MSEFGGLWKHTHKKTSMHTRSGSATLSQLAFPGEGNPNFPWEKPHWNNTVVKSKKQKKKKKNRGKDQLAELRRKPCRT